MRKLLLLSLSLFLMSTAAAQLTQQFQSNAVPPPRFLDPERKAKLAAAFPEIDRIFRDWAQQQPVPGVAWGVVIDGELAHSGAFGFRNLETKAPMTVDSVSRIASMTKSFTAVAILQLRDAGKLSLDDPVAKYVPELAALRYPTKDSPLITIRHLLSHNAGFPEDNPWGDRQLATPSATMSAWMKAALPFSNAPGVAFEYSNYGFAILGQVVARVSGMRYRDYIDKNILQPLGMTSTRWEAESIPADRLATGYKRDGDNWIAEVPLPDGSFAAMGGLYSSVPDLARWVSFFLSAYPPRDDADTAPLRRSSLRLMQTPVSPQRATALRERVDAPLLLSAGGYAFGLRVWQDCRFGHISHGGGLPGFGSLMSWLPEHGVGIVSIANRTYAGPGGPTGAAFEALARSGALQARVPQPSQALLDAQATVNQLYAKWDDDALKNIAADNLLLDRALELRRHRFAELRDKHGDCRPGQGSTIEAENALRGEWKLTCDRGQLRFGITLAPTARPSIQYLETASVFPLGPKLAALATALATRIGTASPTASDLLAPGVDAAPVAHALAAAGAWGTCRVGEVRRGDGDNEATVRFNCDHGLLNVSLALDAPSGKLKAPRLSPAPGEVCVP